MPPPWAAGGRRAWAHDCPGPQVRKSGSPGSEGSVCRGARHRRTPQGVERTGLPDFRTSGPPDGSNHPPMLARIIAVGDELLLGRTVDTNSAHIARWLTDRGFHVDRTVVVGDPQRDIEAALRAASDGAALVIVTGGLGPTDDDRTRQALAAVMGVALVERPQ